MHIPSLLPILVGLLTCCAVAAPYAAGEVAAPQEKKPIWIAVDDIALYTHELHVFLGDENVGLFKALAVRKRAKKIVRVIKEGVWHALHSDPLGKVDAARVLDATDILIKKVNATMLNMVSHHDDFRDLLPNKWGIGLVRRLLEKQLRVSKRLGAVIIDKTPVLYRKIGQQRLDTLYALFAKAIAEFQKQPSAEDMYLEGLSPAELEAEDIYLDELYAELEADELLEDEESEGTLEDW